MAFYAMCQFFVCVLECRAKFLTLIAYDVPTARQDVWSFFKKKVTLVRYRHFPLRTCLQAEYVTLVTVKVPFGELPTNKCLIYWHF